MESFCFYVYTKELKCDKYVNGEESGSPQPYQRPQCLFGLMNGFIGHTDNCSTLRQSVAAGKFEGYLDEFVSGKLEVLATNQANWFREIGGGQILMITQLILVSI